MSEKTTESLRSKFKSQLGLKCFLSNAERGFMKKTYLLILGTLLMTQTALAQRPSIWDQSHKRANDTVGVKPLPTNGPLVKYGMDTANIGAIRQDNIVQLKTQTAELIQARKVAEPVMIKLVKEEVVESEVIAEPIAEVKQLEVQKVQLRQVEVNQLQRSTASELIAE